MKTIILLVLVACISAHRIEKHTQHIVDADGLKKIYHGVNVVYKTFPFYPPVTDRFDPNDSLADIDLENLKSWGMNFIRLHVAWEGVEPVRGEYNTTYLEQIKNIVRRCEKYDITVLLDAHQDVLSRFFCGEGFPDWAVTKTQFVFPYPVRIDFDRDENGYPLIEQCLQQKFLIYYFSKDAQQTFQNFYENVDGLADAFAGFWGVVANYFKDEKNVIGYEIINEPLSGSVFHSVMEMVWPNKGNNKNLLPIYKKVNEQIRQYDTEKLIFFEPGTSDLIGGRFVDGPGGLSYRDREVYSYHNYCPLVDAQSVPKNDLGCKMFDWFLIGGREKAARELGVGKFLTEFGAIVDVPKGNKELDYVIDLMESKSTSWAYWEFKYYNDITTQAKPGNVESFYDQDGNLYHDKVKVLARPYSVSICGSPISSAFKANVQYFVLDWKASNQCNNKRTTIFLSEEFYYKDGKITPKFKNCNGCKLEKVSKSYYEVVLPEDFQEGQQVILTIMHL